MFYKGIIFDLDNTIYNYDICHTEALTNTIQILVEKHIEVFYGYLPLSSNQTIQNAYELCKNKYETISEKIKYDLYNTASCHNKSIYFKHLLEYYGLNLSLLDDLNEKYWTTFLNKMTCFDGVKDFIIWNKMIGIKIGILTDYETEYQIKKCNKLHILPYIDIIVTSEEVGIEKPSIHMFQTILRKMKLNTNEVIMIGDNYKKDIEGAINMNIYSYWFTLNIHEHKHEDEKLEIFSCFQMLQIRLKEKYDELYKLKTLSKYVGERFDLVQAGGGNISIKVDNWMFIKASGINMANITCKNGYVIIDNKKLIKDIKNNNTNDVINYNIFDEKRGSIETYMHSILKKYTLHIHPIQINRVLISSNAKNIISELFPEALIIPYMTPGIKICNAIKEKYNNENIIFLINHGIIITSDIYEEIYELLSDVITTFEKKQDLNFDRYKYTNKVSSYIQTTFDVDVITYLCENKEIKYYIENKPELFQEKITFPDALIYCGIKILFMTNLTEIMEFKTEYNELPKIIVVNNNIYIIANSLNKCKEIEDVFLSNLIILDSDYEKTYLTNDELYYLNNWDAEKYRKII
jgi:FMN phosphatase YigB (HAD superfamily)/rhamnose utilization protein RhaD (predicted bifunctional aldolase and dehydrogenase)